MLDSVRGRRLSFSEREREREREREKDRKNEKKTTREKARAILRGCAGSDVGLCLSLSHTHPLSEVIVGGCSAPAQPT